MNKSFLTVAALGLVLAGTGGALARFASAEWLRQPQTLGADEVFEDKPTASLVGGFRTSTASFLYARAHEYMHGGIVFRAATPFEEMSGRRLASHGDELESHHGAAETSSVPEGEADPRGYWGKIERETQPFMDIRHHGHRDLREALPLFRMMTWSDPHFIEGYSMGTYLIFSAADNDNLPRAMKFLEEGIENNPHSYILHKDRGQYQLYNFKNADEAKKSFLAAAQAIESAPKERLNDRKAEEAWTGLVQAFRKMGETESEIEWARRGLKRFPDCQSCKITLRRQGLKE